MMATDVVLISNLHLSTTLGVDHWGKRRPQPFVVSVYLHLLPSFLTAAGLSDDVIDSINYGHLAKAITGLVHAANARSDPEISGFTSIDAFLNAVTQEAFSLAGNAAVQVRVVLTLPKYIRLATTGVTVDLTTSRTPSSSEGTAQRFLRHGRKITIGDITIPVIIGVNPPEREAKQLVKIHLTFDEYNYSCLSKDDVPCVPDYPSIVDNVVEILLPTTYLTLEKFVFETLRTACVFAGPHVESITVRCEKPSAISLADASGVEMTRVRKTFLKELGMPG